MFWAISLIMIAMMMAILQAMSIVSLQGLVTASAIAPAMGSAMVPAIVPWWLIALRYSLIVIGLLLALIAMRLRGQLAIDAVRPYGSMSQPTLPQASQPFVYQGMLAICCVMLVLISATLAGVAQYQAELKSISQPMRVQARVTVQGLSDSHYQYYPAAAKDSDQGYRQVVVLNEWSPLSNSDSPRLSKSSLSNDSSNLHKPSHVDNPWDTNQGTQPQSKDSPFNHRSQQPLRVLISAYPSKSFNHHHNLTAGHLTTDNPTTASTLDSKARLDPQLSQLNALAPNQQAYMTLVLTPVVYEPRENLDASEFDEYRWLRSRHIDATATVVAVDSRELSVSQSVEQDSSQLRWRLRQHFLQDWYTLSLPEQQARAVTLSLLTGDRALISNTTKYFYQQAGISHLLAISGSHVLFLAVVLASLISTLVNRFNPNVYKRLPRWQLRWLVMLVTAFVYAGFTGFDVPAARTAWMLVALGLVRFTLIPVSRFKVLVALAIAMAGYDPFVLWQAGYWLSFIAVALLLVYEEVWQSRLSNAAGNSLMVNNDKSAFNKSSPLLLSPTNQTIATSSSNVLPLQTQIKALCPDSPLWLIQRGLAQITDLIKLQLWMFLALLPISLLLFGKVSLWGLLINLFAIGWYGLIIVPLNLLAGVSFLISPTLAGWLWALVTQLVEITHTLINQIMTWELFGSAGQAWLYTPMTATTLILIIVAMLPWALSKGLISRWMSLPTVTLLALVLTTSNLRQADTELSVYLLPSDDPNLGMILLIDNVAQSHWLIMADYRSADQLSYLSINIEKVSSQLQQQLALLGVERLEGIVVQTLTASPSKAIKPSSKSSSLREIANRLAQSVPTGKLWLAGEYPQNMASLDESNSSHSEIPVTSCQAGQSWQSTPSAFAIDAVTGWPSLAAEVADCSLAISSQSAIAIYQFNPAKPQASKLITKTVAHHQDKGDQDKHGNNEVNQSDQRRRLDNPNTSLTIDKNSQTLLINGASHPHLWQLWQKLCSTESLVGQDQSPQKILRGATIISHQQAIVDTKMLTLIDPYAVYNDVGERQIMQNQK